MIQINGLTAHQHELLNKLWTTDSLEAVEEWMSGLSEDDQLLAQSLSQLLILENIDSIQNEHFADCSYAQAVLGRF